MIAASPPTESDLWLTFRYQDALPLATLLPIPHSASPKSKLSLISSGRSEATSVEARASRPIAVLPLIVTGSPLPPVPLPKQIAWGLDLSAVVAVAIGFSTSTLPPLPTTRSWALKPLADAPAARARVRVRASAQTAARRNGVILGIYATLSSRVELARSGTGLLASGIREDAPSRGLCVASSGWRARRPRTPPPGHSGGTTPDLHRTSLDHRPICTRRVYPRPQSHSSFRWRYVRKEPCDAARPAAASTYARCPDRTGPLGATRTGGWRGTGRGCCAWAGW